MDRDGVDVYVYFFALFTNDYFYIKEHFKEETWAYHITQVVESKRCAVTIVAYAFELVTATNN